MVGKAERITLEVLESHYHLPMAEVARKFEVCLTYFKKVCRRHGVKRWPYRQLKSIENRQDSTYDAQNVRRTRPEGQRSRRKTRRGEGMSSGYGGPSPEELAHEESEQDHQDQDLGDRSEGSTNTVPSSDHLPPRKRPKYLETAAESNAMDVLAQLAMGVVPVVPAEEELDSKGKKRKAVTALMMEHIVSEGQDGPTRLLGSVKEENGDEVPVNAAVAEASWTDALSATLGLGHSP